VSNLWYVEIVTVFLDEVGFGLVSSSISLRKAVALHDTPQSGKILIKTARF
jgi:hypothetical protein